MYSLHYLFCSLHKAYFSANSDYNSQNDGRYDSSKRSKIENNWLKFGE